IEVGGDAPGSRFGTVQFQVRNAGAQTVPEPLLQAREPFRAPRQIACRNFTGHACADYGRDIFDSGAQSPFLDAAMDQTREPGAAVSIQNTHSLRAMKLVR